jgi:hypothetical protein
LYYITLKRNQAATVVFGGVIPELDYRSDFSSRIEHHVTHICFAISPARRPALTDKRTMTRLRSGFLVVEV